MFTSTNRTRIASWIDVGVWFDELLSVPVELGFFSVEPFPKGPTSPLNRSPPRGPVFGGSPAFFNFSTALVIDVIVIGGYFLSRDNSGSGRHRPLSRSG